MKRAILAALAVTVLAAAALAAVVTGGPALSAAADHVDAPGLTPPGGNLQLDITDVYAWRARNGKTVLAANVNGLTAPGANPVFASGAPSVAKTQAVTYWFKVDNNGDAVPDVNIAVRFGKPDGKGVQKMTVKRNGTVILPGVTSPGNGVKINRSGQVLGYAGLRDDPFFFDLDGFINILSPEPGMSFLGCTSPRTDFFAGKNVSAIVLELPSALLTRSGSSQIGVWATTTTGLTQVDRMGRPAINTVFIPNNPLPPDRVSDGKASLKNAFNSSAPRNDQAKFRTEVVDTLTVLHSLNDAAGDDPSDDAGKISGLADVLLPDILTFDTAASDGFLNGRRLADDVIDAELGLITEGAATTDCVSQNDRAFRAAFPYLANPHN
ncbi:MAG TPA: DUF4331 family protein [Gaiellaceae bacterium]|nr:DUF4331 family protein [Gaiellaceae bacterium]